MTSTPTPAAPAATDLAPPVVGHVRPRRLRRRVAAYAGLAWLRTVFGVLQVVAPDAADRKALDVWCTLPPGARRRAHDHRPGGGEVVRLATARGGDAVAEVWGEGPVVLLVHGWGGWRGQLGRFVAPLVDAGHRVVAVDAPGHGDAGAGFMGPAAARSSRSPTRCTPRRSASRPTASRRSSRTRSARPRPPTPCARACPRTDSPWSRRTPASGPSSRRSRARSA